MARRLKMTPFARFFMVMIVLAPLAYIGASYYNGEDGLQNFLNLIGLGSDKQEVVSDNDYSDPADDPQTTSLQEQIDRLEVRVEQLEKENQELKQELDKKDQEIRYLKERLNE